MQSTKPDKPAFTLEQVTKDKYGQPLVCSGCSHSAAGAPFPGMPSGERPCCFCIRNVELAKWKKEADASAFAHATVERKQKHNACKNAPVFARARTRGHLADRKSVV